uniref:RIKEN cDNA 1700019A02 gene n=1 Tax=Nannospalax galili TaxID=1026970 RepID=A0A8C6S0F5_NANGA
MADAGPNREALAPRMEIIEMNDKRNRQEIVNGLHIFLEENEEDVSLEELEEEFDVLEEEERETISEDGSSKEVHDNVRASQKVSLRSISSMTDEERFNMRIHTTKEFRKSSGASYFGLNMSTEKKRKRLECFGLL